MSSSWALWAWMTSHIWSTEWDAPACQVAWLFSLWNQHTDHRTREVSNSVRTGSTLVCARPTTRSCWARHFPVAVAQYTPTFLPPQFSLSLSLSLFLTQTFLYLLNKHTHTHKFFNKVLMTIRIIKFDPR